ncbi:MAG TPA: MBL fold metallo-hydrolase [Solirubrobacteraceae bacterium]|jgi:phosphoribosyl 1,2-cyclic phosphodiesterase|nr:MBL fold metallo-hydrolase [Solirubrobacteraceae bacterium]
MEVRICGPRGSVPAPGLGTARYGGNTSCVQLGLSDGTHVILDAGTGIRNATIDESAERIHVLLTHLHLDHIQGLLFFAPLFEASADVTIWGPDAGGIPLRNRIGRYMSAPLTPVELRELPSHVEFRDCPAEEWTIGSATIRAEAVIHRGPTLGFRIEDVDTTLCYLPDHEPALLGPLDRLADPWLSGYRLAHRAQLLIHDAQYTEAEYPEHSGWGHSATAHVVEFAARCEAERTVLFHHDPSHTDDELDDLLEEVRDCCHRRGLDPDTLELGREQAVIDLAAARAAERPQAASA